MNNLHCWSWSNQVTNQPSNMESPTNNSTESKASRLEQFYQNKTILITGVTGFLGKVFLLKLLTSLRGFNKVYVMVRSKEGVSAEERFNMMIKKEPFVSPPNDNNPNGHPTWSRLNEENKKGISAEQLDSIDWSKVKPVEVDMSSKGDSLGVSKEMKQELCSSVEIIFHMAASPLYTDTMLKKHLEDNYRSCENMLELSRKFYKLISYVHVSSFYTNSHLSHIEEEIIPFHVASDEMAHIIDGIPESIANKITTDIIEKRANTFTYSKGMAENLLLKYERSLPIAIVRPSSVLPSLSDPYPGWTDDAKGPIGLGVLASLGILREIDWNYDGVFDVIPADYVVNCMLAVAERTARLYPNKIKVYNCSSSSLNPITFGKLFETLRKSNMVAPPYKMLRIPIEPPKHNRASWFDLLLGRLSEWTFAYFMDSLLFIFGQKPLVRKLTSKLHRSYEALKYFTTNNFTCSNENLISAYKELHPNDQEQFCFHPQEINWNEYLEHTYYGVRRLILKEDPDNIPKAKQKMEVHMLVEFSLKLFSYLVYGIFLFQLYDLYFIYRVEYEP